MPPGARQALTQRRVKLFMLSGRFFCPNFSALVSRSKPWLGFVALALSRSMMTRTETPLR